MTQHTWLNDPYLALGAQVRLRRNVDGLPFGPRLQKACCIGPRMHQNGHRAQKWFWCLCRIFPPIAARLWWLRG